MQLKFIYLVCIYLLVSVYSIKLSCFSLTLLLNKSWVSNQICGKICSPNLHSFSFSWSSCVSDVVSLMSLRKLLACVLLKELTFSLILSTQHLTWNKLIFLHYLFFRYSYFYIVNVILLKEDFHRLQMGTFLKKRRGKFKIWKEKENRHRWYITREIDSHWLYNPIVCSENCL